MPLFGKNKKDKAFEKEDIDGDTQPAPAMNGAVPNANGNANGGTDNGAPPTPDQDTQKKPKLSFHCQQAHGSPTGVISGFTNVKELYLKIAQCYNIPSTDVSVLLLFILL